VLIGMTAFCWALWISRNDSVFQKSQYKSILQVIFRGGHSGSGVGMSFLKRKGESF
jgi:hypothetical protein